MLRSMTGFGRCLVEDAENCQQWEIRSVNSRFLDLKWRLPPACRFLEPRLEKIVRQFASRGRLEISLSFLNGNHVATRFDAVQGGAMLDCLKELARARGEECDAGYAELLNVGALWDNGGSDLSAEECERIEEGLALALEDWNASRASEGAVLMGDMQTRIMRLGEWSSLLRERAPEIMEARLEALRERLGTALAKCEIELDENRFLQEVVIYSDKLDVSEELTRLDAHLERLRELIEDGTDAGRRLDFTLQECFREINTFGNKLADAQLSRIVVDFKNELEKCREQAQNLE